MNTSSKKQQKQFNHYVKLLLIGNSGVGKSSLLTQYSDRKFAHNYYNTIGVDYWDTAGQDRFKTITSSYYRNADGILVLYDITDRTSFDNVKTWLDQIDKFVDERTIKYIIGNKIDLEQKRQVRIEEGVSYAQKINVPFRQTSARLSTNVDSVFEDIVRRVINKQYGNISQNNQSKSLSNTSGTVQKPQENKQGLNLKDMYKQKKKQKEGSCCVIY